MKNIKLTAIDNVLLVTINRPEKLNALNSEVIDELSSVFIDHRNDSNVKAIILTGQGDKSFIAGADIKEMSSFTPSDASIYSNKGIDLFNNIESYSKPVVAAINGYALGGAGVGASNSALANPPPHKPYMHCRDPYAVN